MRAIKRSGPGRLRVTEAPRPIPGNGEVLIQVAYAGICGSDLHRVYEADEKWDSVILGHEFAGTVAALGREVSGIAVGDRVSAAPLVPCHACMLCRQGAFSQCSRYSFIGSRRDGAFAEYVAVPALNIIRLPKDMELKFAALLEPITVVLHPLMVCENRPGRIENAVVMGLGPIGLIAVQVLRWFGAANIIGVDVAQRRTALAEQLGAGMGAVAGDKRLDRMLEQLGGADLVFECSGAAAARRTAVEAARSGGTVIMLGTGSEGLTLEAELLEKITRRELILRGSWMSYSAPWPGNEWRLAGTLIAGGSVQCERLISRVLPAEQVQEGVDALRCGEEDGKVMVSF